MATIPAVRITSNPDIMGGWPCVEGTRIPVITMLACINAGESREEIEDGYPSLPPGWYEAVARWAAKNGEPCCAI